MSTIQIELPEATLAMARELADESHVTLDDLLADAITRIAESRRQMAYLRERAERGRHVDIRAILAKSPDVPPVPGDELD